MCSKLHGLQENKVASAISTHTIMQEVVVMNKVNKMKTMFYKTTLNTYVLLLTHECNMCICFLIAVGLQAIFLNCIIFYYHKPLDRSITMSCR